MERLAASAASRIAAWTVAHAEADRREWAEAARAELSEITNGWQRLAWAAGSMRLVIHPGARIRAPHTTATAGEIPVDSDRLNDFGGWLTGLGRNLLALILFYFLLVGSVLAVRKSGVGMDGNFDWTMLSITVALMVTAFAARALGARPVTWFLSGQLAFGISELAFHALFGIDKVQGGQAHWTVMLAGTLAVVCSAAIERGHRSAATGHVWNARDMVGSALRAGRRLRERAGRVAHLGTALFAFALSESLVHALLGLQPFRDGVTHGAILAAALLGAGFGVLAESRRLINPLKRTAIVVTLLMIAGPPLAAQARWIVEPQPILDIKGVDDAGTMVFGAASWATRLRNGTVVIADASGPAVHFVGPNGKLLKSTGRSGQGPGDFRTVTWVAQCGEQSVHAWDFPQMRVTTYDETGNMKRSFPFGTRGGANTFSSCNTRGMFFAFITPRRLPPPTPPDPNARYTIIGSAATPVVVGTAGDTVLKLAEVPYGEMLAGMIGGRAGGMQRPLGSTTTFALGADRLYIGITDSASVMVFALDGKRIGTIAVPSTARAPTAEQYAAATEIPIAIVPAQIRDAYRTFVASASPPPRLPPFTSLFVDPAGMLWVQTSVPGDGDTRFLVYGRDGQLVASVAMPALASVFEVGADYVLGARADTDDEPHLMVYRLRKGRP